MNKKIKNIASVVQTKSAAVLCTLCAVLFLASCAEEEMADGTHSQKQDLRTVSVNFDMPADKPSFGDGTASRAALDAQPAEILLGDSTLAVSRAEGGSQSRSESTSSAWENDDQILVKIDAGSTQARLTLQYIDPAAIPAPASGEEPQTATAGWYLMKDISYVKYTGAEFKAYNAQGVTPMIAGDTSDNADKLAIGFTQPLTLHLDWTASQPTVSIIYAPDMQWSLADAKKAVSLVQKNSATTAPELWTVGTNGWVTNQARLRVNTGRGNVGDVVTLTSSAFDSAWEAEPTVGEGENKKTVFTATTDDQGNAYFYGATTGELKDNFIVQLTKMLVPVQQQGGASLTSEGRSVTLDEATQTVIITLDTPITLLEASDVVPVTLAATKAYKLMAEEKRTAAKTENINTLGVIDGTWGFESDPQGNLNDADAMAVQIKTAMAMGINQFTVVNGLTSLAHMYNTKSIVGQAVIRSTRATGVVSLVLNEDITSLQNVAFAYCMPLGSLSASAVTTIGAGAFNSCVYLTSLTFDKVITSVGTNAFDGNIIDTTTPWTTACDLTLAAGQQDVDDATLKITAVGGKLMWAGKPWESIKIGETEYTAVGDVLCSTNNGVMTTVIDDVTYAVIDGQCGITETDDGGNYIGTADHVTTLKAQIDAAMAMEIDHFLVINQLASYSNQGSAGSVVGEAIRQFGESNSGTKISLTLADATSVPDNAFNGCTALTSVSFEKSVTIGDNAFSGCTALTDINWTKVTSIGASAFSGCTITDTVNLSQLTSVDAAAFSGANVSNCDLTLAEGLLAKNGDLRTNDSAELTVSVSDSKQLMYAGAAWKSITLLDDPAGTANTKYYIDENDMPTVEVDGTCGNEQDGDVDDYYAMTNKIKAVVREASDNIPAKVIVKKGLAPLDGMAKTVVGEALLVGIVHLVLDDAITSIPAEAFYKRTPLVSVTTSATTIGVSAFNNCASLTSVSLRATSATTIESSAFRHCHNLATVNLSANTAIGDYAFNGCSALTGMDWTKVASIGAAAFGGCTITGTLTIGEGVNVDAAAFQDAIVSNCDLVLPADQESNVTVSNGMLMWAGAGWKSITMGDRVYTQMNDFVKLEKAGVTYAVLDGMYGNYTGTDGTEGQFNTYRDYLKAQIATAYTVGITHFYVINELGTYKYEKVVVEEFHGESYSEIIPLTLCVVGEAFTAYANENTNDRVSITLADATTVPKSAFYGCTALTDINCDKVASIGDDAFRNCTALTRVTTAATSIGNSAFNGCTNLQSATFTSDNTEIGPYAFSGCTNLTTLSWDKVTSIGDYAFSECKALENVSSSTVTTVGNFAFRYCTFLKTVSLPEVTTLENAVFRSCASLTKLTLGKVTSVNLDQYTHSFKEFNTEGCDLTLGAGQGGLSPDDDISDGIWAGMQWKSITVGGEQKYSSANAPS